MEQDYSLYYYSLILDVLMLHPLTYSRPEKASYELYYIGSLLLIIIGAFILVLLTLLLIKALLRPRPL